MKRVEEIHELKRLAGRMRENIVKMTGEPRSGPASPALSATEIVAALFFNVMRHDPARPAWPDRDRFILSGSLARPALYCAYGAAGFLDEALLRALPKPGSPIPAHLDRNLLPILEASTAPFGNGLSLGVGAALTGRMEKREYRVYVLLGESECREKKVWEAAALAVNNNADNLSAIVDMAGNSETEPHAARWEACGWDTQVIDGHDFTQILEALDRARHILNRPTCIVARTVTLTAEISPGAASYA